jgi:tetratricopeptide (TPR) repeat protein
MIDFDAIFLEVIRPAVEEAGLLCERLDDMPPGTTLLRNLFSAILGSDLMIADVSLLNPNVMYELGIRHALRRRRTLMIMVAGDPIPSNIGYSRILLYALDSQGRLTGDAATQFSAGLRTALRESERVISESPLYEFFPDLQVELPSEVGVVVRRGTFPRRSRRPGGHGDLASEIAQAEEELRATPDVDSSEYLVLLRHYRDLSEWDQLIRLASEAPPEVRRAPEVVRLLALALYRRERGDKESDQKSAIETLDQLITETGGDSETFGLLGLIYKENYEKHKADGYLGPAALEKLDNAIRAYRAGFEKNPSDYYTGLNVATLLLQRGDEAANEELRKKILPRVRSSVESRIASGLAGFWEHAARMQLAAMARDWDSAEESARNARAYASPSWMVNTARRDLAMLKASVKDTDDAARLGELEAILCGGAEEEGRYA